MAQLTIVGPPDPGQNKLWENRFHAKTILITSTSSGIGRTTVLVGGSPEQLLALAERISDDLAVWENLLKHLSKQDVCYPAVIARVRRLKNDYSRR